MVDRQPSQENPKRGSARERQRRRKERRLRDKQTGVHGVRQLTPAGGWKMPEINLPQNSRYLLLLVGGVIFVVVIIVALGLLRNDEAQSDPNAIWLGTEWTYEQPSNEAVDALVERLRDHRIGTAYAYVSWLKSDAEWAGIRSGTNSFTDVEEDVKNFVKQFKAAYPESSLYAWVSVPNNTLGIPARLDDENVKDAITAFSSRMVGEFGFDGVHLNVEVIWDGDDSFLELLRVVRDRIGAETPLSVAMTPDWSPENADFPVPPRITPGTVWSTEYKQSVALLADEIVVMAYNTDLTADKNNIPMHYSQWMAYQVKAFSEALADLDSASELEDIGTRLLIGIPAYDAEPAHDPQIENIPSAVLGVKMGLEQTEEVDYLTGVAIYAEWAMDDEEWTQFKQQWIQP